VVDPGEAPRGQRVERPGGQAKEVALFDDRPLAQQPFQLREDGYARGACRRSISSRT